MGDPMAMQNQTCVQKEGPLIVVAHQAFDPIASLALVRSLRGMRQAVRVLACREVAGGQDFEGAAHWVDPLERPGAKAFNQDAFEEALRFVKSGGALIIFASGSVALKDPGYRQMLGLAWQNSIAAFIQHADATVIPASVAERTRTEAHTVLFGERIPMRVLDSAERSGSMVSFLRLTTGALARWNGKTAKSFAPLSVIGAKIWPRLVGTDEATMKNALIGH